MDLRPYQIEDVARLRQEYARHRRAVLYQLATGGGKTVVFSHIVQGAATKGRRTAVLTHRRELISQASDKLGIYGVPHGIVAAGLDRDHDAPTLVMSIQSAINRDLPQFDFIVIDEAHHAVAETWAALLARWPAAKILGVSATPARTDGKGLGVHCGGLFDAMVCGPSMATLIRDGYLVPSTIYEPGAKIDTTGLRKVAGDWAGGDEMAKRASVVTGDAIAEYAAKAAGRSALAFCVTVEHAEHVAASFRDAGMRSECVHGSTPKVIRDSLIAGLGNGDLDVLTSCDLIGEGLDVPSVGAVILLRPTASLILCLQQLGRGMRPSPGKTDLVVLDHAGNVERHGDPDEDRTWSLDGVERAPAAERRGADPDAVGLGKKREIEEVDGDLVVRVKDPLRKWRNMTLGGFRKAKRSDADIAAFALAKGYKRGWCAKFAEEQRLGMVWDRVQARMVMPNEVAERPISWWGR